MLARGRTALKAARGESGPLVGVCEACGQPMVAALGSSLAPIEIRLSTRAGEVVVQGPVVRGPDGDRIEPDDAEAFLAHELRTPWVGRYLADLRHVPFFLVLLPIVVGWFAAGLFVLSFLASVYQGPAPAVSGSPGYYVSPTGYDGTRRPQPKPEPEPEPTGDAGDAPR